jgi:hypothetical protein
MRPTIPDASHLHQVLRGNSGKTNAARYFFDESSLAIRAGVFSKTASTSTVGSICIVTQAFMCRFDGFYFGQRDKRVQMRGLPTDVGRHKRDPLEEVGTREPRKRDGDRQ